MGPVGSSAGIERAESLARGEVALRGERDRRRRPAPQRRESEDASDPDADQFEHRAVEPENDE